MYVLSRISGFGVLPSVLKSETNMASYSFKLLFLRFSIRAMKEAGNITFEIILLTKYFFL